MLEVYNEQCFTTFLFKWKLIVYNFVNNYEKSVPQRIIYLLYVYELVLLMWYFIVDKKSY